MTARRPATKDARKAWDRVREEERSVIEARAREYELQVQMKELREKCKGLEETLTESRNQVCDESRKYEAALKAHWAAVEEHDRMKTALNAAVRANARRAKLAAEHATHAAEEEAQKASLYVGHCTDWRIQEPDRAAAVKKLSEVAKLLGGKA